MRVVKKLLEKLLPAVELRWLLFFIPGRCGDAVYGVLGTRPGSSPWQGGEGVKKGIRRRLGRARLCLAKIIPLQWELLASVQEQHTGIIAVFSLCSPPNGAQAAQPLSSQGSVHGLLLAHSVLAGSLSCLPWHSFSGGDALQH